MIFGEGHLIGIPVPIVWTIVCAIGVLNNGLNLVGVDPLLQFAVVGLIVWFAIALCRRRVR